MRINDAVKTDMENSVLCWLATVSERGVPNVTPKEIFAAHDDQTIVIADIASSNSVGNIRACPDVCVSFVDIFRQRGFKISGKGMIVAPGEARFGELCAPLAAKAGSAYPIRNVIAVAVGRIARIWAPSYSLAPGESEADKMHAAYAAYGVMPIDRSGS